MRSRARIDHDQGEQTAVIRQYRTCGIRGTVVHDDDLPRVPERLSCQRVELLADGPSGVATRNNDAQTDIVSFDGSGTAHVA
jgi:hypothetical protein